ncbi:DUF4136 domain-containing protein [Oxalicibacterium solurbis]|uniref:DUF4136 domain-containing protein n=1 Tax=Oxalicibacterium solurbis TaxID=69280 RepID=A0A8J3F7V6_9BURK|nr:DUF4136 domain-containing protein [Oxalicibacterium solurbis]GGI52833.1 hypothetical protein GCM10011430_00070 [Oxalicibacterium solurbis]
MLPIPKPRAMAGIAACFTVLLLAGCASKPTIHVDSDRNVDFSRYHTYGWQTQPDVPVPLMRQRLMDGIDARLQAKGWRRVTNGEVVVVAHVATQQQQTLTTMYDGGPYAGWGWRTPGFGTATTYVDTYETGTLVVDLFDAASKRAIWRGTARAVMPENPDKGNALLEQSLDGMFADFPPGTAAKSK